MRKYYYKCVNRDGDIYYAVQDKPANNSHFVQITQSEYEQARAKDVRAEKEALFKRLMIELYPQEEE